jgi:hypothetical protein
LSYVYNNPVNYNDPSGHRRCDDTGPNGNCTTYQIKEEKASSPKPSTPVTPKTPSPSYIPRTDDEDENKTYSQKASEGDLNSIIKLILPTHIGLRGQGELSFNFLLGVSITVGGNVVYNFNSGELAANVDWTGELGAGLMQGGSGTGGFLLGWESTNVDDVTQGLSAIVSATGSYETAGSISLAVPLDKSTILHVDPVYGQVPFTLYAGVGAGTPYGSIGGGLTGPTGLYIKKRIN